MSDQIQYREIAKRLGVDDSTVRRLIAKHGPSLAITVQKGRSNTSNSKWTHFISREDADRLIAFYEKQNAVIDRDDDGIDDQIQDFGYFYLIQLVPEALPNRIKVGYTDDLDQRLRDHQTAAPTARVIASWPCKRSWDYAAMDSVTRADCRWVLNEVWEGDPEGFAKRAAAFFANMPTEAQQRQLSDYSPLKDEPPNQLLPTPISVTPAADSPVAPATGAADL